MRMAYGRGGTRLARIPVAAPFTEYIAMPWWLKSLLAMVWIAVPILVSLYAVPQAVHQTPTVIDVSRLARELPPSIVIPEPLPARQPRHTPPPEPQQKRAEVVARTTPLHSAVSPPPEELHPVITRPASTWPAVAEAARPALVRERVVPLSAATAPLPLRLKRQSAVSEAPAQAPAAAIKRARGVAAAEGLPAREQVALLRAAPAPEVPSRGSGDSSREIVRERAALSPAPALGYGASAVAGRERKAATESTEGGPTVGLERGVSLMSLEICASPGQEEDAIREVMGVIGERESCRNGKGTFRFTGTKRISSFNLMIYPAKGRRPSNRCEELKNAYNCLETN